VRRFGIGAISEGGHSIINEHAAHAVGATPQELQATITRESQELARRIQVYRDGHDHLPVKGRALMSALSVLSVLSVLLQLAVASSWLGWWLQVPALVLGVGLFMLSENIVLAGD
jgi:hypothetical protein